MGLAPEPGAKRKQDEANVVLTITVGDESRAFNPNNVPLVARTKFRKAHGGIPFEQYVGEESAGLDSIAALFWLAGVVNDPATDESADDVMRLVEQMLDERGDGAFAMDASHGAPEITEDSPPS